MHYVTPVTGSGHDVEAIQTHEKHNNRASDGLGKRNGGGELEKAYSLLKTSQSADSSPEDTPPTSTSRTSYEGTCQAQDWAN
jgi:hypothetical protein